MTKRRRRKEKERWRRSKGKKTGDGSQERIHAKTHIERRTDRRPGEEAGVWNYKTLHGIISHTARERNR